MTPSKSHESAEADPDLTGEPKPEVTGSKQALTQFKPGQSGNPKGRPRGSRAKLAEAYVEGLYRAYMERGQEAIDVVAKRQPDVFLKILKDIMPREIMLKAFNVNASLDLTAIEQSQGRLSAYKYAKAYLNNDVIVAEPVDAEEGAVVTEG